ncbi:hypothetical protein HK100_003164, partial [Physocladia obscura]
MTTSTENIDTKEELSPDAIPSAAPRGHWVWIPEDEESSVPIAQYQSTESPPAGEFKIRFDQKVKGDDYAGEYIWKWAGGYRGHGHRGQRHKRSHSRTRRDNSRTRHTGKHRSHSSDSSSSSSDSDSEDEVGRSAEHDERIAYKLQKKEYKDQMKEYEKAVKLQHHDYKNQLREQFRGARSRSTFSGPPVPPVPPAPPLPPFIFAQTFS